MEVSTVLTVIFPEKFVAELVFCIETFCCREGFVVITFPNYGA